MICKCGHKLQRVATSLEREKWVHEGTSQECAPDEEQSFLYAEMLCAGLRQIHGVELIPGRIQ